MERPKQYIIKRLSFDFSRDAHRDEAKRGLLPAKWLLEGMVVWPDTNSKYVTFFNWLCFYNLLIIQIFHVSYVFTNIVEITDVASATATVTTTMEALVRIFVLIVKKEVLNDVLYKVHVNFWPVKILAPNEVKKMKTKMTITVILTSGFLLLAVVCNTQITGVPYVIKDGLILKSVFPFQWNTTYVYEIVYIWQYFSDWFVLFMINAFDFFFMALVMTCAIQYIVLQEVTRNILSERTKKHRLIIFGEGWEKFTDMELLLKCHEQHKILIEICRQLENSFIFVILFQFFNSTSAICVSSLVMMVDVSQFFKMFTYVVAHILQLFYYCYAGNELSYHSEALSDAVYESEWTLEYNRDFRKALVSMIQRAQKKQCLTAAGITELDFASFLKVMRISFSFYTLLNSLLEKRMNKY